MFQESETSRRFEAQLLRAMMESESKVRRGLLAVRDITEAFNQGKSERNQVRPEMIGRKLRSMGFQSKRTHRGMDIYWDERLIGVLKSKYGLEKPTQPSHPTPSRQDIREDWESTLPNPNLHAANTGVGCAGDVGSASLPSGPPCYTPVSFANLFRDTNPHHVLVEAGRMLNRLMAERNIRWDRLHAYIKEQHPTLHEKTRAVQRRIFAELEVYLKKDRDAESLSPELVKDLKVWLALRIYWIGLCAVDHEA